MREVYIDVLISQILHKSLLMKEIYMEVGNDMANKMLLAASRNSIGMFTFGQL